MTEPTRSTALTLALVLLVLIGLWGLVSGGLGLSSAFAGPDASGAMVSRQMEMMQRLPGAKQSPELTAQMAELGKKVAQEITGVAARWRLTQLVLAVLGLLLGLGLLTGAVRAWRARPGARGFLTRLLWIAIGFTVVRAAINQRVTGETMAAMRPLMEATMANLPGTAGGPSAGQIAAFSTLATQIFAVMGALLAAGLYGVVMWVLRLPDSLAWLEPKVVEVVEMPETV